MTPEEIMQLTDLDESKMQKINCLIEVLPIVAELAGMDLFVDCRRKSDDKMFVAAQAVPAYMPSAYKTNVVGQTAEPDDEPAVYHAVEHGVPMRDIKAVTQEDAVVKQIVVPVSEDGIVVGALIGERDVKEDLCSNRRLKAMSRQLEKQKGRLSESDEVLVRREVHHRIKNQLQIIASMLNLQAREAEDERIKQICRENSSRILNVATVNEMLCNSSDEKIALKSYLERICTNIRLIYNNPNVEMELSGDDIYIAHSKANDIALVVNELISNAYKHAFPQGKKGNIRISLSAGCAYNSVTVRDNGTGRDDTKSIPEGFGLSLIKSIVKDKLGGKIYFFSDQEGTTMTVDF